MKNWDIFVAGVSILPAVSTGGRPTGFEDVIQVSKNPEMDPGSETGGYARVLLL
jgi:hypothetical protein